MSLDKISQKLSRPPRAGYMRPSFFRMLLFIPIFLVVFPMGSWLGIGYYYYFQEQGMTFFLHPIVYFVLFSFVMFFVRQIEIRYIWQHIYQEMSGSWHSPFEGPISEIFCIGVIVTLWKGPETFEPLIEGVLWMLASTFSGG